jgi:hypothetical protein
MGTDNIFHKRKARKIYELRRQKAKCAPYDRVLIVCEGEKTEPNYFKRLREKLRLKTANIVIVDDKSGVDPLKVVNFAIEKYLNEYKKGYKFNRIYCVFDKDRHATYNTALKKVDISSRLKGGATLYAITSVPCFEVWILLHFEYTTRPFCAAGIGASHCATVETQLKKHIPNYLKGKPDIHDIVTEKLPNALRNAKQLTDFHENSGTDNPSTNVHELIEYLQNISDKKS